MGGPARCITRFDAGASGDLFCFHALIVTCFLSEVTERIKF
jgi:hypothetical protein